MVLLVLVAIGIVWVVVKNLISSGEDNINLGFVTTSLKIENVKVNDENVEVRIKREAGEGEVSGLKFMIDDGIESQTFTENFAIKELETKRFELNYSGIVKEVSVSPIFKTESGKEKVGNVANTFKTDSIGFDTLKEDYGLVSWWRFEGNADDEMGENNGVLGGNINCNNQGKYGKACEFDGVDDHINTSTNSFPLGNNDRTVFLWFKENSGELTNNNTSPFFYGNGSLANSSFYFVLMNNIELCVGRWGGSPRDSPCLFNASSNFWHYSAITYDGTTATLYSDGVKKEEARTFDIPNTNIKTYFGIIWDDTTPNRPKFNGTIDEVMVFNKALTDEQIKLISEIKMS